MTKTIKIQLVPKEEGLDYKEVNKLLWQLQKETRAASNRCVQLCWEYGGFESEWKEKTGEYLSGEKRNEILGKSLTTIIYNRIKQDAPNMNTANLAALSQSVCSRFNAIKGKILRGELSIPSYKRDIPIELQKRCIILEGREDENGNVVEWMFRLALFSSEAKKKHNLSSTVLRFKAIVPAKSAKTTRAILKCCYDNIYSISSSKLKYDNGKWFILLCYSFDNTKKLLNITSASNIMGVHIAKDIAIICNFSDSEKKLTIYGDEVKRFEEQVEKRRQDIRKSSLKHSTTCGGGRVGHGYRKKMEPLEHISKKITNFRNTTNHRYSRQIVNWAVDNKCGIIQIEDLRGLSTDALERYTLLKNWSYYDLIDKIAQKAKEFGIKVVPVGHKNLWKWCNDCKILTLERHVKEDSAEYAICPHCGQMYVIDYNIEKALVTKDINKMLKDKYE